MPYIRPMHVRELDIYAACDERLTPGRLAEIESAVAAGAKLTMECSTVSDPQEFTRVLLDGREVARAEGY